MTCIRCGSPLDALHIVEGCPKRPSDEIIERATKVMHAEVCCPCDPQGCDWTHTREARYARALADAGMLAQPMYKIALDRLQELAEARGYDRGFHLGWDAALDQMKGQDQCGRAR